MVFLNRTAIFSYLTVLVLLIGCSGGGGQAPMSPDTTGAELTGQVKSEAAGNVYIWGTGEVTINAETGEVTVVPLRTVDFNLNVVMFLQNPGGIQIALTFVDPANAYVELDCTLNHPFSGSEFWGFDTRIAVFAGGSTTGVHDNTVKYPTPTELRMENADGYTRWFNHDEFWPTDKLFGYTDGAHAPMFTINWATVNGYKYYANGITSTQMPPNPAEAERGSFSSGSVTREMKLQFPQVTQPFKFKYSVITSWAPPDPIPPTGVDDFPVAANTPEAYQIVVTQDPDSTAYYEDGANFGGNLILDVEVWDWKQGGGTVEGEIAAIYLESPTLLSSAVEITGTWTVSPGSSSNSVTYSGTLLNVTPTDTEDQEIFVTVESSVPDAYIPPVSGFTWPSATLAAYQLHAAYILDTGVPPEKTITVTVPDGGENFYIGQSETITWDYTGPIVNVVIEYSDDSGATYPYLIEGGVACSDQTYAWNPVPDNPTNTARVRITEDLPVPEAQDESDDDFTIKEEGPEEPGWNVIPGQEGKIVDDPEPNQSTVQPDLGIQNDDEGNEGAWMVDQAGDSGHPMAFFDYLLDWSGPGGNAYPSGFNYNFAPMGRHDVSSNGIVITGCSANTNQIDPPIWNDPMTTIWYVSYILADEGDPGDLLTVSWSDSGEGDPPSDDPEERPWYHRADVSGGLPGWQGTELDDCLFSLMCFSHEAGAPAIPDEDSGDLNICIWAYPYLTTTIIYALGFPEYTTDNMPLPFFEAFDVSDPTKMRIAVDSDSYLSFGDPYDGLINLVYMIDSVNNIYMTGFQIDFDAGMFGYWGLEASMKMFTDGEFYFEGGTAVDLESLPTTTYLYGGDPEEGMNWVAILYDDGSGGWVVRVYHVDWGIDPIEEIAIVDTTDPISGTPLALDVDPINFTIHVLYEDGGAIKATVFDYTPD